MKAPERYECLACGHTEPFSRGLVDKLLNRIPERACGDCGESLAVVTHHETWDTVAGMRKPTADEERGGVTGRRDR